MLKAITFDLWQTLILDTPEGLRRARAERIRRVQDVLTSQGLEAGSSDVEAAYNAVGFQLETLWATHQDVGSREQVRILLGGLGLGGVVPSEGPTMDALDQAYCLPILSALPVPNAGAREVLAMLRAREIQLALICNTGRTPGKMLRLVLERLGISPSLSVLTFSDEVGWRKPHPEIFARTLAALGVLPGEAAHVGDDVTTDIAGARGIGMRAVHLCHSTGISRQSDGADVIESLFNLPTVLFPAD